MKSMKAMAQAFICEVCSTPRSNPFVAMAMKKAMKTMKAMKAMKSMKAMKVSVIAKGKMARADVFNGNKEKTRTGLTKAMLVKSKTGKIVSKKASATSKKRFATSRAKAWSDATK